MHRDLVETRGWISEHRFLHAAYRLGSRTLRKAWLWSVAVCALLLTVGLDHTLTTMAWFFTFAALLTFGGAYAVLPYVYEAAVHQHRWVTAPGPLIMIVAFVGFLAGYTEALFFAGHTWWPHGFSGTFDAFAALLTLAATLALLGSRVGVVAVIGCCALAGAAVQLF